MLVIFGERIQDHETSASGLQRPSWGQRQLESCRQGLKFSIKKGCWSSLVWASLQTSTSSETGKCGENEPHVGLNPGLSPPSYPALSLHRRSPWSNGVNPETGGKGCLQNMAPRRTRWLRVGARPREAFQHECLSRSAWRHCPSLVWFKSVMVPPRLLREVLSPLMVLSGLKFQKGLSEEPRDSLDKNET